MTKLEQLIEELCPNGVEYRKLSEVTTIERGRRVVKEQLSHDSGYPVFQNSLTPMGFHTDSNYPAETSYVIGAGAAGEIGYCKEDFWAADDCFPIVCGDSVINRYVYHFLLWQQPVLLSKVRKASIPRLSRSVIENLMIPVPPLPVQSEIVHILDNFTELTVELTVELTARRKQYEYYRNKVLSLQSNGCKLLLKDIANTFRGEYITKSSTKEGNIPVILGGQEPAYYIDKYNHEGEIVVVARSGASAGFVSYWNERIFITDGFGYEAKQSIVTQKYLYYILKNIEAKLNSMKRGAGVPHVSGEALNNLEFIIPTLKEQERIVAILDRFDTLCNDISAGLPAEIEARQKQYEYYRDKLLSFTELSSKGA